MTVDEFYLLTDARPDNEKWELIDGEPILNASPSDFHQVILGNLVFVLTSLQRNAGATWRAIPGIGARVSDISRPEPDVMILPSPPQPGELARRDTTEAVALFQIMSPSTRSRDLKWKRAAYTSMPALSHYVVVAQDAVDVVAFDREHGFEEQRYQSLDDAIAFPVLGISLPLFEIYRDAGL